MLIRPETEADSLAVYAVHATAFGSSCEAELVEVLRREASPAVSLVAEKDGAVVGHILFTPVAFDGRPDLLAMGLAPMAVAPSRQRMGIGSALVKAGLERCQQLGAGGVVVLGHPEYYPRFGFVPSSRFGFRSEFEVPEEVFLAQELQAGALDGCGELARYHPAFRQAEA